MAWRAFSGLMGRGLSASEQFAWLDVTSDGWDEARRNLAVDLDKFGEDSCSHCRDQAAEAISDLQLAATDTEFWAEVDGHDYALIKV